MMNGKEFVALERITDREGKVLAAAGDTCERVPAISLGWLEEGGYIKRTSSRAPSSVGAKKSPAPSEPSVEAPKEKGE